MATFPIYWKKENSGRLNERVTEKIKAREWRNKRKKQEMTKRQRSNPGDKPKWKDKTLTRLSRRTSRYRAETEQEHDAHNPPPRTVTTDRRQRRGKW